MYECRFDERLKTKAEESTDLVYTGLLGELEHLKIETRLIDKMFTSVMGISVRVADVTEVLLSLTTVKNVMVSTNEDSCHWIGEVPAGTVKGRTIKWVSKSKGREQLSIQWELGIRDDGYVPGQVTYTAPEISDQWVRLPRLT